ncbi:type III PLP-dependent enzyme [Streptomyces silvisoli]|uniref:Type III PLP-dependent enzyme n=1 Tax=Streptomyces silvisoli TaxID=3034235 RepID=A0ABT5ZR83_9ACTN|nr:type III PLP-dependent enzyme [Streptomyces silvisoli]MDF3291578.1 type III PLP-dependent enzyme [Streptomyces silvisoli]
MRSKILHHVQDLSDDELPAYLYDLAALRSHTRTIRRELPDPVELFYAAKANSDARLLRALGEHVDGFEVASGGELQHVRRLFPTSRVAFGGPGKTARELTHALEAGVERLHVESQHELCVLTTLIGERTVDVLLRVNPPLPLGRLPLVMGGQPSPFGMDPAQLDACLRVLAAHPRIRLRGLHAHLASGLDAPAQLALVERIVDWGARWTRAHGLPFDEVNLGGGMGVDYANPERFFDWSAFGIGLRRLLADHPGLTLRIEPGRSIGAYCGWYVTRVLDVKFSHGEAFAVLAGGTHHLRTPATRGHDQPFEIIPSDTWSWPGPRSAVRLEPVTLVGQLCTPKDVLASRVPVIRLRTGDRVAFAMAGAYAWNISHHDFLMHPEPSFHYLDDERPTTPETATADRQRPAQGAGDQTCPVR